MQLAELYNTLTTDEALKKTVFIGKYGDFNSWIRLDMVDKDLYTFSHIYGTSEKPEDYILMNTFRYSKFLGMQSVTKSLLVDVGYLVKSDINEDQEFAFGKKLI